MRSITSVAGPKRRFTAMQRYVPQSEHKPTWSGHRECAAATLVTPSLSSGNLADIGGNALWAGAARPALQLALG